ncbi:MAG: hypothetical protein NT007_17545 [Candidatus Kapabacteria bacterium]|nr:hypothetical protein [Candidatus Kapabacteria bacterium]
MSIKNIFYYLFFLVIVSKSFGQLSGYTSLGHGYYSNPLYSYLMQSSRASQGYIELNYGLPLKSDLFAVKYVGSLSIFNQIQERNYYDHRISAGYTFVFDRLSPIRLCALRDSSENEENDSLEAEAKDDSTEVFDDSTSKYLSFRLKGGSRIDHSVFREFDNWHSGFAASYRLMIFDSLYLRLDNDLAIRKYYILPTLSNLTNLFSLSFGSKTSPIVNYGLSLSFGVKHFVNEYKDTLYDRFLDSNFISYQPDELLQFTPSFYYSRKFGQVEVSGEIHYNKNFQKNARFIVPDDTTDYRYVNEDIYNESYSYEGLGGRLKYKHLLPLNIQLGLGLDVQQKHLGYAGYSLIGDTVAARRFDLRTNVDFSLSRYFEVYKNLSAELILLAGYDRNQSNDEFNNYYLYYWLIGLGVGF